MRSHFSFAQCRHETRKMSTRPQSLNTSDCRSPWPWARASLSKRKRRCQKNLPLRIRDLCLWTPQTCNGKAATKLKDFSYLFKHLLSVSTEELLVHPVGVEVEVLHDEICRVEVRKASCRVSLLFSNHNFFYSRFPHILRADFPLKNYY